MSFLAYCIFAGDGDDGYEARLGVGGQPLCCVKRAGLVAVVSELRAFEARPEARELLAYASVIEAFGARRAVIPLRYGCRFEERADIGILLEARNHHYRSLLERVRDHVEMGIRSIKSRAASVESTFLEPRTGPAPQASRTDGRALGSGAAYLAGRRTVFAAQDMAALTHYRVAEDVKKHLCGLFTECLSETEQAADHYLVSLCFLVPKDLLERFLVAARRLAGFQPSLVVSGPWPPYNFVSNTVAMCRIRSGADTMFFVGTCSGTSALR